MQTINELLSSAEQNNKSIGQIALTWQANTDNKSEEDTMAKMNRRLQVMKQSVEHGLSPELRSVSGMVGGQSSKLNSTDNRNRFGMPGIAFAYAMAVAESNACMGKIVAAPTAGSCGILPAAVLSVQEELKLTDNEVCHSLFTASAIGMVATIQATVSGAEGGCQAECGVAAAMAAAAIVELYGGTPKQVVDAASFAIMNLLGLVCDPVRGLVEIPCVYRNVGGVSQAFAAAQMALSGLNCPIPCDEMILAIKEVGDAMPSSLKETGEGGCAGCASMK